MITQDEMIELHNAIYNALDDYNYTEDGVDDIAYQARQTIDMWVQDNE